MGKFNLSQNVKLIAVSIMAFTSFSATAHGAKPTINADAAILVNADTGKIIDKFNEDQPLGIASMTKMMTEYLVLEAIQKGKLSWDDTYKVTDKVYQLANAPGLSNVPLRAGEDYSIKELYEAMVIKSGNGAAIALSEAVSGSEGAFVKKMNEKAKDLGMEQYRFVNASGLSNYDMLGMHPDGTGVNDENMVSAEDMATLAYRLIKDFPEVLKTSGTNYKYFRKGTDEEYLMKNTNALLEGRAYSYEGADGLKTGTTPFAGSTFTGTAERDGVRYITVILDAKDQYGTPSSAERFIQSRELLEYGFNEFKTAQFNLDDAAVKGHTLPVKDGVESKVKISLNHPLKVQLPKKDINQAPLALRLDKEKVDANGELIAPVKKGEKIGELVFESNDGEEYILDELKQEKKVSVYAAATVEKANWFVRSARHIGAFLDELFS
ncbi:D-alanyl-D-alanine carboxypeptidase [Rossellomorea aquimaris]|uniref:D-alanyl-D-alanine carboxypeptidase family protein n=1 Tax=Rossellomorea aquimaris TaxID=189382 RepID=UPI001CD2D274|nr:D-alanyl-D-alanine carboxypeptidase family protein [Rossellomorea aquimaris]MCA1053791.1 D-alanyl-D-alanine carboxypeptidase [Rossellomorea aquimaris]